MRNLGFPVLMVPTASASTQATVGWLVELAFLVVSSYLDHSGARLNLHPELADESGDGPAVLLCHHCFDKEKPPRMSITNNEVMPMSTVHVYRGDSSRHVPPS